MVCRFDDIVERTEAEREIIGNHHRPPTSTSSFNIGTGDFNYTKPATPEAKKMEGAYVGFQPKPAVEVILVISKGKSLTWLDDCRIPYSSDSDKEGAQSRTDGFNGRSKYDGDQYADDDYSLKMINNVKLNEKGRFPANLAIQDDVLQDYSRYFSLDSWSKTFPFLITPKASKAERNKGLENIPEKFIPVFDETKNVRVNEIDKNELGEYLKYHREKKNLNKAKLGELIDTFGSAISNWELGYNIPTPTDWFKLKQVLEFDSKYDKAITEFNEIQCIQTIQDTKFPQVRRAFKHNHHPTVKPLKLMSYLITLGSRENDLVLDPFCGSGTTCIAAQTLHRGYVGIEINEEYYKIAQARLSPYLEQTKLI